MQRIITYLGNINLRSEYIYFLIAASVFIIILLFLARLVKLYFPTFSYGLIVMCLWALIITYAFSLDFLKVSPLAYYLSLILILLSFITYSKLKKNFNWKEILIGKDSKYLLKLFITWCLGMAIMLAPMILVFAKGTVIPTRIISSDSVIHSLLSKGTIYTNQIGLNSFIENYPRGFQAFTYYSNSFLNIDVKLLLLPILALGYSFIIFFVEDLVRNKKYISGLGKLIVMLLPFSSFLITFTFYALFVSQIAAIPILLFCLSLIFKKEISSKLKFILFVILSIATLNIYGIFAVNVIGVGVAFYVLNYIYNKLKNRENIFKDVRSLFNDLKAKKNELVAILMGFILILPSIYVGLRNSLSALTHTDIIIQGKGNLQEFLSPFHLTGLWLPGIEYREPLTSHVANILMFVLIIQIFFILKVKLSKNIYAIFIVLAFVMALSIFGFQNVYIHFKYLTYLIPFFLVVFGISLIKFFDGFKFSFISKVLLIIFVFTSLIISAYSLNKVAPATEEYFQTLNTIKVDYLDKYKVMLFSQDAWFRYYSSDNYDDYEPIDSIYQDREFKENTGKNLDYIIVDTFFNIENDVEAYLKETPEIKSIVDKTPKNCIKTTDRFIIYNLKCD